MNRRLCLLTMSKLGPQHKRFLNRELKSVITFKAGKEKPSTAKNKGAGGSQKNKNKPTKARVEYYDDDIVGADNWENDDPIDDSFPEIREAPEECPPKRKKSTRNKTQDDSQIDISKSGGSDSERCFKALCDLRQKVKHNLLLNGLSDIHHSLLRNKGARSLIS